MLTVSEGIARAAIERKESRGAHFREDYSEKSKEWGQYNLIVRKSHDGSMMVERRPVIEPSAELQRVIAENK